MSSSPLYLDPVVLPFIRGETMLDVGCGYGRWCMLIHTNFWEAGLQMPPVVDGLDAYAPNVEFCARHGYYRRVWQQELPSPLEGQWDTVLACEFLEHLRQDDIEEVVDLLESVARQRVVFSTPNFPDFRGGGETVVGFNEFEAHRSYVPRAFFRRRGYRLLGSGFGNPRHPLVRGLTRFGLASSLYSTVRLLLASRRQSLQSRTSSTLAMQRRSLPAAPALSAVGLLRRFSTTATRPTLQTIYRRELWRTFPRVPSSPMSTCPSPAPRARRLVLLFPVLCY